MKPSIKEYEPFWISNTKKPGTQPTHFLLVLPVVGDVSDNDILKMIRQADETAGFEYFSIAKFPKETFCKKTNIDIPEICDYILVRQFEKSGEDFLSINVEKNEHNGTDFIMVKFNEMSQGSKAIN